MVFDRVLQLGRERLDGADQFFEVVRLPQVRFEILLVQLEDRDRVLLVTLRKGDELPLHNPVHLEVHPLYLHDVFNDENILVVLDLRQNLFVQIL